MVAPNSVCKVVVLQGVRVFAGSVTGFGVCVFVVALLLVCVVSPQKRR